MKQLAWLCSTSTVSLSEALRLMHNNQSVKIRICSFTAQLFLGRHWCYIMFYDLSSCLHQGYQTGLVQLLK